MILRLRVFWRLLFLQTAFTSEQMQNRGFLYALLPATSRFNQEQLTEFMTRQNRFFNSHPWMAGWAAGLQLYALEHDEDATTLKETLITPLGAIGDRLYWRLLKPLSALPAALGVLAGLFGFTTVFWLGLGSGFLLLNLPHLHMRWHGLSRSLRLGRESLHLLLALRDGPLLGKLRAMGSILLGVLLAWLAAWQQSNSIRELVLLVGGALLYAGLLRQKLQLAVRLLLMLLIATCVIIAWPGTM
ncbi:MAG: PTS system mannose/fructose/sorbose family transporter subunit IID [Candidatus Delongbacteria bacterium]|nr:PTS system mannose/fructose/sorbose family transporter subunit IID [Candidatus Delongbacteria bacterium]